MKPIALRLMAVFAIVTLLGGPAFSAHADTGTTITHPSIALRQTLEGTPQMEPIETLPQTTEPVETDPPVTAEPTDEEFIFVFCHVAPDGSQETMRFSIDDPAGAAYFIVPAHGGAILLYPDDYWGECVTQPTQIPPMDIPPTELPTTEPTATVAPSETAQPTGTATSAPGSPPPTPPIGAGTPTPTGTAVTAPPTATSPSYPTTVPTGTPTTAPGHGEEGSQPPVVPPYDGSNWQPPAPPANSQKGNTAQAPAPATPQQPAQPEPADIPPTTVDGLPTAGSGPSIQDPNTRMVLVLTLVAAAVGCGSAGFGLRRRNPR